MKKLIEQDFINGLIKYLLERPAKEVLTAILTLQALPNAPEETKKEENV